MKTKLETQLRVQKKPAVPLLSPPAVQVSLPQEEKIDLLGLLIEFMQQQIEVQNHATPEPSTVAEIPRFLCGLEKQKFLQTSFCPDWLRFCADEWDVLWMGGKEFYFQKRWEVGDWSTRMERRLQLC